VQAEQRRRSPRSLDSPAARFEGATDVAALHLVQGDEPIVVAVRDERAPGLDLAHLDDRRVGQDAGALDHVLQLADVPRPGVAPQAFERSGRDVPQGLGHLPPELLHEVPREKGDVVRPFSQRRDADGAHDEDADEDADEDDDAEDDESEDDADSDDDSDDQSDADEDADEEDGGDR
jgi:hypothetical protein